MGRITGRVEILKDNQIMLSKTGAVASGIGVGGPNNFELKEVMGDGGIHGFVEEPVVAKLEVTITDTDDAPLSDFAAIQDGSSSIVFQAGAGGKRYSLNKPTCTRNISVTSGEGETTLVFIGHYWTEDTFVKA